MMEFSSSISETLQARILAELEEIQHSNDVEIIFAVESGSRAWGFPSPDSDYDVRFVYRHKPDWYLSLLPGRDVIELPIDDELDINGWDIRKALNLMLKPNPVMLEWLSSPIRYQWDDVLIDKLINFSRRVSHSSACLNHYLSLTRKQWEKHIEGNADVKLKKYFYAARPAMNICWLRIYPDTIPPMNFQALMRNLNLNVNLQKELERLVKLKSLTKEVGLGKRVKIIDDFILKEMKWAQDAVKTTRPVKTDLKEEANSLFRKIVKA